MKQVLLDRLKQVISEQGLSAGDRLPAERRLAQVLGVSRNSLRRVLHMLEGSGMVEIQKGSGTFLKERFFQSSGPVVENEGLTSIPVLLEHLTAAFHLIPFIIELAVAHMDTPVLRALQKRNVALSQSIMSNDPQQVWRDSLSFFRQIVAAVDNSILVTVFDDICLAGPLPFESFFDLQPPRREQVFGHHVSLLNALREGDREKARQITQDYIMQLCDILEEKVGVMPDVVRAYREREAHEQDF